METVSDWLGKKLERFKQSQSLPSDSGEMTEKERERLFVKNGSKLLEEMITRCKGKCRCNPIRTFSAKQVLDATECFRSAFLTEGRYKWYSGVLDGQPVMIKKHESLPHEATFDGTFRDIAISSQMSSQKNVLRLIGCCLEFVAPVLVYENAKNGPLRNSGDKDFNGVSLPWKTRLRVARDVANTITFLHTAFHRPIIHRDIKPRNIFLGEDHVPKLTSFDLCISIPEGETQVEDDVIVGTLGFMDPMINNSEKPHYSEYNDVYSFGVFLLVLLTGEKPATKYENGESKHISNYIADLVEDGRFDEIVDCKIREEEGGVSEERKQQFLAFTEIAFRCIQEKDRPQMIDVAKELAKIARSTCVALAT